MDYQSIIRAHIDAQVKRHKFEVQQASFSNLNQKEKRKLAAYELQGPDGQDMLVNHDGPQLTALLYSYYAKENVSAEQVLDFFMDAIIRRNSPQISQTFDNETENYQQERACNNAISRSADRSRNPNAHSFI